MIVVAALAVNCGCAFASLAVPQHQAKQPAAGHCEPSGDSSHGAQTSEGCCGECTLQIGALNSQTLPFQLERSQGGLSGNPLFASFFLPLIVKDSLLVERFSPSDKQSMPGQPLYILLGSLLI